MNLPKIGLVVVLFGGLTSCAEFIEYPLEEEQVDGVIPEMGYALDKIVNCE